MPRSLKIDLADLALAFETSGLELTYYLNLETGEVFPVLHEMQSAYEEISEAAETGDLEFSEAVAQSDLPDWMKEDMALVAAVEEDDGSRFIAVPDDDSSEGYRDMAAFVETVPDARIRNRLLAAFSGGRPFRRFKDAIGAYPREEERWFTFQDERLRQRVIEWLRDEDIEPV